MDVKGFFVRKGVYIEFHGKSYGVKVENPQVDFSLDDFKLQIKDVGRASFLDAMSLMENGSESRRFSSLILRLLDKTSLEEFLESLKSWSPDIESIKLVDEEMDFHLDERRLVLPLRSPQAGYLGSIVVEGNLSKELVLDFMGLLHPMSSLLEGIILGNRAVEMMKSSLDALSTAMEMRVREGERKKEVKRRVFEKLKKFYDGDEEAFELSFFVYDVGLIGVRDYILKKDFKSLTKEELEEYKMHPVYGYEILKEIENIPRDVLLATLYHHERIDGSGFPFGKKDGEIPRVALYIGLVDEISRGLVDGLKASEIAGKLEGKFPKSMVNLAREVLE